MENVKKAYQSNLSLEELCLSGGSYLDARELNLLLQGIAGVPRLRSLSLKLLGSFESAHQLSTMFANALIDYHNNYIEGVGSFSVSGTPHDTEIWNKTVMPILHFTRERRLFQKSSCGNRQKEYERLLQAIIAADETNNHHLCFWFVRNYAGELCCGMADAHKLRIINASAKRMEQAHNHNTASSLEAGSTNTKPKVNL
jgi:hypothetical protein